MSSIRSSFRWSPSLLTIFLGSTWLDYVMLKTLGMCLYAPTHIYLVPNLKIFKLYVFGPYYREINNN